MGFSPAAIPKRENSCLEGAMLGALLEARGCVGNGPVEDPQKPEKTQQPLHHFSHPG